MLKKITSVAAACMALSFAGGAHAAAVTFDSVGDASTLYYVLSHDGASLNTSFAFTLSSLAATTATFTIMATNASSGPGGNVLMSFGIDIVAPRLLTAAADSDWDAGVREILPGSGDGSSTPGNRVDLCVYAGPGCAGAGIFGGLGEGASDGFSLTLTTAGNFLTDGITFTSPYSAKWQNVGVSGNSYESTAGCFGSPTCGGGGGETSVPEPATLALVALALLGVGAASRRRSI